MEAGDKKETIQRHTIEWLPVVTPRNCKWTSHEQYNRFFNTLADDADSQIIALNRNNPGLLAPEFTPEMFITELQGFYRYLPRQACINTVQIAINSTQGQPLQLLTSDSRSDQFFYLQAQMMAEEAGITLLPPVTGIQASSYRFNNKRVTVIDDWLLSGRQKKQLVEKSWIPNKSFQIFTGASTYRGRNWLESNTDLVYSHAHIPSVYEAISSDTLALISILMYDRPIEWLDQCYAPDPYSYMGNMVSEMPVKNAIAVSFAKVPDGFSIPNKMLNYRGVELFPFYDHTNRKYA